jgi:chloramphenicol O-acetyltransferase type A
MDRADPGDGKRPRKMRILKPEELTRRDLFEFFRRLDYPHFNVCAEVDLTQTHGYARAQGLSLFTSILFAVTKAANGIQELRFRIRGDEVVEHDRVHPSFTVITEEKVFGFCEAPFSDDVALFFREAAKRIEQTRKQAILTDEPGRDDYLYISSLPWVRFTSISHPIHMSPTDSVPRISWGKYQREGVRIMLPLSIQVHHALADGYHVGRFFQEVQKLMDRPEEVLGEAARG